MSLITAPTSAECQVLLELAPRKAHCLQDLEELGPPGKMGKASQNAADLEAEQHGTQTWRALSSTALCVLIAFEQGK